MSDRDRNHGTPLGARQWIVRLCNRAEQSKRLEVDPDDLQARLLARVDVAVDELAVGNDEENTADGLALRR